jgi:phosphatidate phosphatase APP1
MSVTRGSEADAQGSAATLARLHRAARLEDAVYERLEPRLRQRGWRDTLVPYTGYGTPSWLRVFGRLLLGRPGGASGRNRAVRGWRSFATLPVADEPVLVEVGGRQHEVRTDRGGYIDAVVEAELEPGWRSIRLQRAGAEPVEAPVLVLDPDARLAVVSDIDDTVMVTALPRPLLAAWNTFVLDEYARSPVPGMAVLYERLTRAHPDAPVFYLSTGAWNVAPTLTRFLSRNLYPPGPLLLTDWGPTTERWFRSGQAHKRTALARLAGEFPHIRWLLIGDDGQHDPEIYGDFAASHPDNVAAVAIRRRPRRSARAAGVVGVRARRRRSGPAAGRARTAVGPGIRHAQQQLPSGRRGPPGR